MSPFLKCENCLKHLDITEKCAHPSRCMDLGWIGRLLAYLFGWR